MSTHDDMTNMSRAAAGNPVKLSCGCDDYGTGCQSPALHVDPTKGEYLDERGNVRRCSACRPGSRTRQHVCGLAGLQNMLRI